MTKLFSTCTALITPYDSNGIDYKNLAYLVDRQLKGGADALLVNGTTAEPALLSEDELWRQAAFVIDYVKGRAKVMVGCGSVSTEKTLSNCQRAARLGADCLLVVTPYYNKTSQQGVIAHYRYIADKAEAPIIMYNVPARTGFCMNADTIIALSRHPNIIGLKQSTPDISQSSDIFPALSEDFVLYCGDDCNLLPMLSVGAEGLISVASNICPSFVFKAVRERSLLDFYTLKKISDLCFIETNPMPVKYIMHKLGFLDSYYLRMPLFPLSADKRRQIDESLPLFKKLLALEDSE